MTVSLGSDFSKARIELLHSKYAKIIEGVSLEKTDCPIVLIAKENIFEFLDFIRLDEVLEYNFLSDITAYDHNPKHVTIPDYNLGVVKSEGDSARFFVVYHLLSLQNKDRIRVKVPVDDGEEVPSVCGLWKGANWLEREVWDLYGIRFSGHPYLRRIMLDDRWEDHPLRKDYPIKRYQFFSDGMEISATGLED